MARRLSSVLEAFCKYAEPTEAPPIFTVWSGIATIGAVMGRDCFVDWGYYTVYPNLYIVFIGASGVTRKSSSIGFASYYLSRPEIEVNLIGQKLTPEALIGSLSRLSAQPGATKIARQAVGIAVADELNTLVDSNSFRSGLIGLLTNLYDCKDFTYETRGRGKEEVRNPCFSMLGGSTINWVRECIPVQSIMGGFTARIIFVFKEGRDKRVPRPYMTEEMRSIREDIAHDLVEIAKIRGPFAMDEEAGVIYDNEYDRFLDYSPLISEQMLQGYANRRHDMVTKVAMVVSASKNDGRVITASDLATAIKIMTKVEEHMPKIVQAISSTEQGDITLELGKHIQRAKIVTRADLVRKYKHRVSVNTLNDILRALDEEGWISCRVDGRTITYVYTGDQLGSKQ